MCQERGPRRSPTASPMRLDEGEVCPDAHMVRGPQGEIIRTRRVETHAARADGQGTRNPEIIDTAIPACPKGVECRCTMQEAVRAAAPLVTLLPGMAVLPWARHNTPSGRRPGDASRSPLVRGVSWISEMSRPRSWGALSASRSRRAPAGSGARRSRRPLRPPRRACAGCPWLP